ncbi:uncharacterized protein UDID_00395 [Ustilago sp. UG-2017a]|nr:uncharacterized protein UDID_00395 [Ustilago sp. UG-2017a]
MERGSSLRSVRSSSGKVGSHTRSRPLARSQASREVSGSGETTRSYYDLYPERKQTGPYIPKSALVAPEEAASQSASPAPEGSSVCRSRSSSRLEPARKEASHSSEKRHAGAFLLPPDTSRKRTEGSTSVRRSLSSTYAASSVALGRARPRTITLEPVKSIDEIIKTHSGNLLSAPQSQRGPQRSASWSAFESTTPLSQSNSVRSSTYDEEPSKSDSEGSEGSVEQETRAVLRTTHSNDIGRRLSRLSIGGTTSSVSETGHGALQSPARREVNTKSLASGLTSLTLCTKVKVAGSPLLQVSFADVGLETGHPVMVFLGLGASRHLIGLYDEVAASLGLRLVCIDRWGIGRTDSVQSDGRNILSWSFVVEQVADLLEIDRFSILAHSAGAPFAVALALLFPHRIQGPLHLLAPWTGMQQDSGYRWLRYVPDGVIKTAQAAEWKIQNWKLNKEGSRGANRNAFTQAEEPCYDIRQYDLEEFDKGPTPPPKERTHRRNNALAEHGTSLPSSKSGETQAETRKVVDGSRPALSWQISDSQMAEAERNSAVELLKASHAESARGLVDDLQMVLGKRPWGFGYTDLQADCEVWHGSKDERIPLSSSINLSREMKACSLHVVEGASHSLMTNSEVVVEVFESIRKRSGR